MARGNKYICSTCGKVYEFCVKCQVTAPTYDAERFCSKPHAEIFNILSKHGCNLATAEETLEALKGYNTTGLSDAVQAHINSLQPPKAETQKGVKSSSKKQAVDTQE